MGPEIGIAFVCGAVIGALAMLAALVVGRGENKFRELGHVPEPPKFDDSDQRFRMWLHSFEDHYRISAKTKGAESQTELAVIVAVQMTRNSFERIKTGGV